MGQQTITINQELTEDPATESPTLKLMKDALARVQEVLGNAEKTIAMLQQNLTQVSTQRIGLQHQENMLVELIGKIQEIEKKK